MSISSASSANTSKLPEEVLSLIFREAHSELEGNEYLGCLRPSHKSVPLNVSWVCSRWRQAAISTPQLWTSLAIISNKRESIPSDEELLKLYVSRSGDILPVSVVFDYRKRKKSESLELGGNDIKSEDSAIEKSMHRILQVLKKVQDRWLILAVYSPSISALYEILDCFKTGAPSLVYLSLSSDDDYRIQEEPKEKNIGSFAIDFTLCPQLSAISLFNPKYWVTLSPLQSSNPLMNMTSLELEHTRSQPDALNWLHSCPSLEFLTIRFFAARPFALPFATLLTLKRLSHFALRCYSGYDEFSEDGDTRLVDSDPVAFLSLLILPALQNFSLYMNGHFNIGPREPWSHVRELIQRSDNPPLYSLELLGTPMYASDLVEILQLTPNLKRLCVDGGLTTEGFLQLLSYSPTQDLLCPAMESIEIYAYYRELEPLVHMITSRRRRIRSLDEVLGEASSEVHDAVSPLKMLTLVYRKNTEKFNLEQYPIFDLLKAHVTNITQSRMSPLLWYDP